WAGISIASARWAIIGATVMAGFPISFQIGTIIGGPWALYFVLWFILLALGLEISSKESKNYVAVLGGLASGFLLATPYYYLAIPLLVASALSAGVLGKVASLVSHISVAVPIIALFGSQNLTGTSLPELYSLNAVSFVNGPALISAGSFLSPLLNSPTPLPDVREVIIGYSVSSLVLPVYILMIIAAVSISTVALRMMKTILPRTEGGSFIQNLPYLPSGLIGTLLFFYLIGALQQPFGYNTALSSVEFALGGVVSLAAGFSLFMGYHLIDRRVGLVALQFSIREMGARIIDESSKTLQMIQGGESRIISLSLHDQKSRILEIRHEVETGLETFMNMGRKDAHLKLRRFRALANTLADKQVDTRYELINQYNVALEQYQEASKLGQSVGIEPPGSLSSPTKETITTLDNEGILQAHIGLLEAMSMYVEKIVDSTGKALQTIQSQFDPKYTIASLEISRNFIEQQNPKAALDACIESLQLMNKRFGKTGVDLLSKILSATEELQPVLQTKILQLADEFGDDAYEKELSIIRELASEKDKVTIRETILDATEIAQMRDLISRSLIEMVSALMERLHEIENKLDHTLPKAFDWGRRAHIYPIAEKMVADLGSDVSGKEFLETVKIATSDLKSILEVLDEYITAVEFVNNYTTADALISRIFAKNGRVRSDDLPFNFETKFLRLFMLKNKGFDLKEDGELLVQKQSGVSKKKEVK
ncbi:MAG: hypothetical protein IH932_04485, partial [Thaumarchaeota archaeon]|nr:hypothetical protein [Nitrososphaerota archaeon]